MEMKKYLIYLMMSLAIAGFNSCTDDDSVEPQNPEIETPENPDEPETPTDPENPDEPNDPDTPENPEDRKTQETPEQGGKILDRLFQLGRDHSTYGCRRLRNKPEQTFSVSNLSFLTRLNILPARKLPVRSLTTMHALQLPGLWLTGLNMRLFSSDVLFGGIRHPMIINTFSESYDFSGKTIIPFCTYASTYRDETLARIVELTPDANHLDGEGLTSSRITSRNISSWLYRIGIIE